MSENLRNLSGKCKSYKDCYVVFQTDERALLEGVLLESDNENATLLTPEDLPAPPDSDYEVPRHGGETFGPRYRRYYRLLVPLSKVTEVYLFPYHFPSFPYIYSRNYPYNSYLDQRNYSYNPYVYSRNTPYNLFLDQRNYLYRY